jgi:MurNAc alpha-1-phosphate uridylyltransferase
MILAAGRGERLRPLTDRIPKALVAVAGEALIHRHLRALSAAGFRQLVINHAWLGEQLLASIGDGSAWNLQVQWSAEAQALETAGGIAMALPMLGNEPFLVLNADVVCDFPLRAALELGQQLDAKPAETAPLLACCLLVDNPSHHPEGDFELDGRRLTFSGIGIYRPELFAGIRPGESAKLGPLLKSAQAQGRWLGIHHRGRWFDVGTPERLAQAENWLTHTGERPSTSAWQGSGDDD